MSGRSDLETRKIVPVLLLAALLIVLGLLFDRTGSLHGAEELGPDVERVTTDPAARASEPAREGRRPHDAPRRR